MSSPTDTPDNAGVSPGGDQPATITLNPTISISPQTDLQIVQDAWKLLISTHPSTMLVPQPLQRPLNMTITNTRGNNRWGDDLSKEAKIPGHLRVYASHANGIRLDARGGQFDTLCKVHKEVQADIMCGQEHNLDTRCQSAPYCTRRRYNIGNATAWCSVSPLSRSFPTTNRVVHLS